MKEMIGCDEIGCEEIYLGIITNTGKSIGVGEG